MQEIKIDRERETERHGDRERDIWLVLKCNQVLKNQLCNNDSTHNWTTYDQLSVTLINLTKLYKNKVSCEGI